MSINQLTAKQCIERYLQIRNAKALYKKAADERLKKYDIGLNALADRLSDIMAESGTDQLKGGGGTAYPEIKDKISVSSAEELRAYIVNSIKEGDEDAICLLNAAANKTSVMEYLRDNDELPPGVSKYSERVIVVRTDPKAKGTKK